MNAKKVLVPIDFSVGSEADVELATSLSKDSGASLLLVHVVVPPVAVGGGEVVDIETSTTTEQLRSSLDQSLPDASM